MADRELPGLGPASLVPKLARLGAAELSKLAALGAEAGFVLSRVDGVTTLGQICLLMPFDEAHTVSLLRRLWEEGALELPGRARPASAPPPETRPSAQPQVTPAAAARAAAPLPPDEGPIDLSAEQRARINEFFAGLETRDAFSLLGVARTADAKEVKRAYFKLSKEFHPDRYYGKQLGPYKERLTKIFQALKAAFELLSDPERRRAYEESLG
jgi:DnaJ-domain-containing protein 1